ncbi:MAG: FAD-dependent oxidoreductase [Stenotrophomonas sp.]
MDKIFDLIVVGGGSSGLPLAFFAAERGASVLLLEHAPELGGSLLVASGQMSAANTRLQAIKGIQDSAEEHFADVMRISRGTADPVLVRLAVEHAGETFDWLEDMGFSALPDHPVSGNAHEPYLKDRYYWAENGGLALRDTLVPLVMKHVKKGNIALKLEHEVKELLLNEKGGIAGVVGSSSAGERFTFQGRFVALTSGGYAANPQLFEELNGYPQYTAQPYPYTQGIGIRLGLSAGGYLRGHRNVYNNFGSVINSDIFPHPLAGRALTYPEMRQPWEIYVNAEGDRFIREDLESIDAREMALSMQTDRRYWIVFDQNILNTAPPVLWGRTRQDVQKAFDEGGPAFISADTLEELASLTGVHAPRLKRAIDGYNYGVNTGNDFFGRKHLPVPIGTGRLYAMRLLGSATSSAVGIAVNENLNVVRDDGTPIPNLYAAGEVLGAGQTMGKAACGGMMVTPALTFGRLLGKQIIPF